MRCKNCGSEIKEGNRFCTNCGNKIQNKKAIILLCISVILLLIYLLGIYIVTRNINIELIVNSIEITRLVIIFLIGLSITLIPLFILLKERNTDSHNNKSNND